MTGVVNTPVRGYGVFMTDLTPEAMRAARAILHWTLRDLAANAGVALSTVHQIESGSRDAQKATASKIVDTFRAHGVEVFGEPSPGARLHRT